MKLECLGKLPFGTYAELERTNVNMNEIDTSDCDNSLESLKVRAFTLSLVLCPYPNCCVRLEQREVLNLLFYDLMQNRCSREKLVKPTVYFLMHANKKLAAPANS